MEYTKCHVCEGELPEYPVRIVNDFLFCSLKCLREFEMMIK